MNLKVQLIHVESLGISLLSQNFEQTSETKSSKPFIELLALVRLNNSPSVFPPLAEPSDPLPAGAEEAGSADRVPHHFADVPRRHVQSGPVLRTLQGCLRRQVRRNLPGTGGPAAQHYQTAGMIP